MFKRTFGSKMVGVVQESYSTKAKTTPNGIPFAKAKVGQFFQDQPKLHNPYSTDGPLKRYLKRLLPAEVNI